jgi:hypothetical protein
MTASGFPADGTPRPLFSPDGRLLAEIRSEVDMAKHADEALAVLTR